MWNSPDLTPLKDLGLVLVSSDYSRYSGGGGWQPYGRMTRGMTSAAVLRATANHRGFYDPVMHDSLDQVFTGTQSATAKIPAGATLWVLK